MSLTTVTTSEEAREVETEATRRLLTERRDSAAAEYVAAQTALTAFERTGEGGSMTFKCKCGETTVLPFISPLA